MKKNDNNSCESELSNQHLKFINTRVINKGCNCLFKLQWIRLLFQKYKYSINWNTELVNKKIYAIKKNKQIYNGKEKINTKLTWGKEFNLLLTFEFLFKVFMAAFKQLRACSSDWIEKTSLFDIPSMLTLVLLLSILRAEARWSSKVGC